jgi:DNA (cytosine-5)-methyltransferase 1
VSLESRKLTRTYTFMDLFAGCGGMTRGFVDSGRFAPTFAVELDRDAAETYRRNFGDHVLQVRIEDVPAWPQVDVVIGGPPCQGFSALNRDGVGLERRTLWRQYYAALRDSGATAFVMENVPQLLASPEYLEFKTKVALLGFHVVQDVLLAADFGVPQSRRRAIAIGVKHGIARLPDPTHFRPDGPLLQNDDRPWRTFEWAVNNPVPLSLEPDGRRWHTARNPTAKSIERYKTIPAEGEGRFELAARRPDITPSCWLRKKSGTTDVFGRLWWQRPAYTIRTEFFKPEKGRYLHPSEHRPITLREGARCMSFPDDFELPEDQTMTSVARQIGNAVPCLLAQRIADELAGCLDERDRPELSIVPPMPERDLSFSAVA